MGRGDIVKQEGRCGVTFPRGFRVASARAGLYPDADRDDLVILAAEKPVVTAAVFTTNRFVAAPISYCRDLYRDRRRFRAVVANAGNANCGTGRAGEEIVHATARVAAEGLGTVEEEILVASTGVIGRVPPREQLLAGVSRCLERLAAEPDPTAAEKAARALMTTDTVPKLTERESESVRWGGMAKGAGMIHPCMATMLAFITTDAVADPDTADRTLRAVVDRTFNTISVDNDMSTNDMVLLMASGASGKKPATFEEDLEMICRDLAEQIVRDGEGATRVARIVVSGAVSEKEARRIADAIGTSFLFKTALHGGDPNWGRILAAVGRSGVAVDPENVSISIGENLLFRNGEPCAENQEKCLRAMREKVVVVTVNVGRGHGEWTHLTCDLSKEYVTINADYTT
ncbi:MAG: bifunctional glutamate N-acetyltransferase/amino-acid acetyltransferase ArgJ [Candidatus Hydrogenedentota bacterium]|nr:MAG: bifunctional glutamate N-acetyltransferase/amino-acid acetyltransferase ArgJ [Candidatus Hydrogenedentota bacterium]